MSANLIKLVLMSLVLASTQVRTVKVLQKKCAHGGSVVVGT